MKKIMKKIILITLAALLLFSLCGCREATRVSYNMSKEADQFNITRRVVVYNTRTDKVIMEVIGNLSVQKSDGDIDIIVEVAPNRYKKHFVGLNDWTNYSVEDISGAFVDRYHYELNYLPEMLLPFVVTMSD